MESSKREFLKIAGLTALGLTTVPVLNVFAENGHEEHSEVQEEQGTRYGMVIDLTKCLAAEGCKDCMIACHQAHNVPAIKDEGEEIKWVWLEEFENAFPNHENEFAEKAWRKKPTIVLCNHCKEAPCVRVCPTKATFKRDDGIVLMDFHRCIGCRYCMAACPYGSRSFNWSDPRKSPISEVNPDFPTRTKGVVEKCNFCAERLSKGQLPACVEACRNKKANAITFGNLNDPDSEVRELIRTNRTIRRKQSLGTKPSVYYII